MQNINESLDKAIASIAELKAQLNGEYSLKLSDLAKQEETIIKDRKVNAEKAKDLKEKEKGMTTNLTRIEEGEARIRKDEELTKFQAKLDEDIAQLSKREKIASDQESTVKAKLEEVEARELKLLEKERTYKAKIEQDILTRFLTK